jgi:hypothetical protein
MIPVLAHCSDHELSPICHSELMHDAANVHLNGGLGDAELACNSLIRIALTKEAEYILLFGGKVRGMDYFVGTYISMAAAG